MLMGALVHQQRTGRGQYLSCAVHEAVAKNTELDLMNWIMRRAPLYRQTCRHAGEKVSLVPSIAHTKDGRWFTMTLLGPRDRANLVPFLSRYGMAGDLADAELEQRIVLASDSGSGVATEAAAHAEEVVGRFVRKFSVRVDAVARRARSRADLCAAAQAARERRRRALARPADVQRDRPSRARPVLHVRHEQVGVRRAVARWAPGATRGRGQRVGPRRPRGDDAGAPTDHHDAAG